MSSDAALARAAYAAFNRGDVDAALARMDPEIEWHMSARFARGERVFRGHEGVRRVFERFTDSVEGFHTEPREFVDIGDRVMVPVRLAGTVRGSERPFVVDLVHLWTVRDHLAVRLDVFDTVQDARARAAEGPGGSSDR